MPKIGTRPTSARTSATRYSSAAGSPGPLTSISASGEPASTACASVVHGCTRRRAPRARRLSVIEVFTPVSISAIVGPCSPAVGSSATAAAGVTSRARSSPTIDSSAAIAAGAGGVVARVAHDRGAGVDPIGLHCRGADAVVADVRVGEGDQLARVGGVGHRLLVTGHAGVEDDLTGRGHRRADGLPVEAGAVLEQDVAHAALRANARSR